MDQINVRSRAGQVMIDTKNSLDTADMLVRPISVLVLSSSVSDMDLIVLVLAVAFVALIGTARF